MPVIHIIAIINSQYSIIHVCMYNGRTIMVWNRSHTASDIINMLDAFRRDLLQTTATITRMLPNVPTATTLIPKVAPAIDAACDVRFKRSALENYAGWKVEPTMYVCTMYYEGLGRGGMWRSSTHL